MTDAHADDQFCPACGKQQPYDNRFCAQCGKELHASATSSPHNDEATESGENMLSQIRTEIDDLKAIAASFGIDRIRDGTWFNEFIRAMLSSYSARIIAGGGIEFFRSKYPGLTQEQIATKLSELATRYAALAGGASGATASAAFAATIGSAGGAGIVAVPAGVTAITAEMLYTTRLQLRLVYDLSTIYGYPIDVDDPEDLYRAFCMAYGVAFTTGNAGVVVKATAPEIARAQIRGLIHGNTAAIQQVAIRLLGPRIGRQITQRAILRAAVPVVGIGISATWNYASTNAIATSARHGLRSVGKLRDAVADVAHVLKTNPDDAAIVLESMLLVIMADGRFDQYEQEVFDCVVRQLNVPPEALARIEERVGVSATIVEQRLRAIEDSELKTTLATCLQLVAVADGQVVDTEVEVLRRLHAALGRELDLEQLREQANQFKLPTTKMQQVGASVGALGSSVGEKLRGWFPKRAKGAHASEEIEIEVSGEDEPSEAPDPTADDILKQIRELAALRADGIITDAEFEAKKQELLARL